ncbi:MAG: Ig-like domain-containing protein, partial [Gammaproteobacteria bacterium]
MFQTTAAVMTQPGGLWRRAIPRVPAMLAAAALAHGCSDAALPRQAPSLNAMDPAGGATEVAVDAAIRADFSIAMDASTLNAATFAVGCPGPVAGSVVYHAALNRAVFTPAAALPGDATCVATIRTGARSAWAWRCRRTSAGASRPHWIRRWSPWAARFS